jgi:hypothetical protein
MLEALRHYFTEDYKARFRHNMICVAIATTVYLLCNEEKYPEAFAMQTGIGALFICFVVSVLLYMFRHRDDVYIASTKLKPNVPYSSSKQMGLQIDPHAALRRRLLVGVAWVLPLVLIGEATPTVEGAIVNARLNKYLQGKPTREKLEETAQIVTDTAEHKLHASPALVVKAANHFASYQSSLVGLPLTFSQLTPGVTGTPTDPKGPPIAYGTGCATPPIAGADADSGNIFGFAVIRVENCADLVIWPTKPEVLRLDNLNSKNVTFVNMVLEYNGGRLKLENVRFINCTFQVSDAYTNNPNVLKLLAAALSGQRINLELP